MKTGILVHGCNLNIENWRSVAWGEPPEGPGRIPTGILLAVEYQAEIIVFGTGASRKQFRFGSRADAAAPTLVEAEFSLEFLKTHLDQLVQFDELANRISWLKHPTKRAEEFQNLLDRIVTDCESMNTYQELYNAGKVFASRGCDRVILVSSPSHIVRCLRDAAAIYQADPQFKRFRLSLFACPSVTCYEGTKPADVVVVEPPHRPDRHVVPTHRRIQRMMMLQKLPHESIVALIEEFDDLLQKYEDIYYAAKVAGQKAQ
ncbi:MAG TPA: ElyC/SanA/YdcF family protein [Pirellulaceae bacterium]|nr:ElyC/SanA/YdcF family protein [Pirellulaceae bacterium]HMO93276.1 ElyC/SanA/YdcF family protein [Pirellulaceae bacterium]HMP70184.1 ElyC/SanA/YdcF family protein [Pirellulaceae bacterium]